MLDAKLAFDATKTIAEGIMGALNWKGAKDKDYFEHIVSPVYENSRVIYQNYVGIFEKLIGLLDNEGSGINDSIKFLETNRREYQALRVDIRAIALEMEQSPRFKDDRFFLGIAALMKGGASQREGGYVRWDNYDYNRHTILSFVKGMSQSEVAPSQQNLHFQKQAEQQVRCLERAWEDIAAGYAKMKHDLFD